LCGEFDDQQFSEQDELVVTSFSQTLALVIAQAKDRNERRRLVQERELLAKLALELSAAGNLEKAGDVICHVSRSMWQWESCALSIRRSGNSRFRYVMPSKETLGEKATVVQEFDLSHLPGYELLKAGEPLITEAATSQPERRLIVPIPIEGEEMAILDIIALPEHPFKDSDKSFARRLADILSPTLARCQAEARNQAFLSLAFNLTAATTAEDAARIIAGTADELLTWDSCSLLLHHPELQMWQGILHMDIINGERQNVFSPYPALVPPGPIARQTLDKGPQLILRDPCSIEEGGLHRFGDTTRRSLSLMFVPFRVGSAVGGVFSIQSYTPYAYNSKDLQLLQALADYCAGAVERIRLAQGIPDPINYDQPELTPQTAPQKSSRKKKVSNRPPK
jgi:GAF domain-containing protein